MDMSCCQNTSFEQCTFPHEHGRPHTINMSEGKWSLLPDFLLWMIKDKLDIFDDMRLTAVCRDWWVASAGYSKHSVGDGMPWVMQPSNGISSGARDFINVARNKKFTIELPEFQLSIVLFSKQGWILLRLMKCPLMGRMVDSVVLVNPFTKATIKMPDLMEIDSSKCFGSFSTREGYPHCVVLVETSVYGDFTIRKACPGDEVWTEHSYVARSICIGSRNGLLIIGQNVYCFDVDGNMIIYHMPSQLLKELPGRQDELVVTCHIVELEGHVIKLDRFGYDPCSYEVFRYVDTDNSWERLNSGDLNDLSWFLMDRYSCFAAKKEGLKAYVLGRRYDSCISFLQRKSSNKCCYIHDFVDGSTEKIHLNYHLLGSALWVDIG